MDIVKNGNFFRFVSCKNYLVSLFLSCDRNKWNKGALRFFFAFWQEFNVYREFLNPNETSSLPQSPWRLKSFFNLEQRGFT